MDSDTVIAISIGFYLTFPYLIWGTINKFYNIWRALGSLLASEEFPALIHVQLDIGVEPETLLDPEYAAIVVEFHQCVQEMVPQLQPFLKVNFFRAYDAGEVDN